MKKRRKISGITRRWILNNLSIIAGAIVLVMISGALFVTEYFYDSLRVSVESRVSSTANFMNRYMTSDQQNFYNEASKYVSNYTDKDKIELQVIDASGRIMFSSTGLTAGFIPSTDDITDCLYERKSVTFIGYDSLTGEDIIASSSPIIIQNGRLIGAVRFVSSLKVLRTQMSRSYLMLFGLGALLIFMIFISNRYFLRSIVDPVIRINELTKRIEAGEYGAKLDVAYPDEIGELCETINHMSEEIGRMEKLKNDFISSVSHELRTPLTAIGGWTETLATDFDDRELQRSGLSIIHKETQRLSQMVEELLEFSRLETGAFRLTLEPMDIRGELYDAVFMYTEALKQEGMQLNYDEPDEPIIIAGDKNRLKQVFVNIIDNALKYGKDGGKVEIRARSDEQSCYITIQDFGAGILEEELPFVKEKFFRGRTSARGTGIGLAVSNEIVALHKGSLDIESALGEGTKIIITIPLHVEPEEAKE